MNAPATPADLSTVPLSVLDTATLKQVAVDQGVCCRPLMRQVTDRATGGTTTIPIPCGSTRSAICPACAAKAARLRMTQCREGWHLIDEPPTPEPAEPDPDAQTDADADDANEPESESHEDDGARRVRSTRRRQDAPDLPRVPMDAATVGKTFTAPDGSTYRPSMFVTLTLPSYGRIIPGTGVPADPSRYDYRRAALDALHFPKLVDRWVQNLRRCAGYRVQYFGAVEAQRRLAPHLHIALRGAIPRATLRAVTAATYVQLWWPAHTDDDIVYADPDGYPVHDGACGRYVDPSTGAALTTWAEALDALDGDAFAAPAHVVRFGAQVDIKGLLGGTPDSDRAVRYLCKYLTKDIATTYTDDLDDSDDAADAGSGTDRAYAAHIDRLHAETRWLPCSPSCANWLRYGIEPDQPGPGLVPGRCPSKAHDRETLGLGGRRCLVSRKWSGKTLAHHKADRAAVVRAALEAAGIDAPNARRMAADEPHTDGLPRYVWENLPVEARDYAAAIASAIAQATRWRHEYEHAKALLTPPDPPPDGPVDSHSAIAA